MSNSSDSPTVIRPQLQPAPTVVIPALNATTTIRRQLVALDHQTFAQHFDVVVVDNGSTDGTAAVVRSYEAKTFRLRIVREPRRGINVARNAGIAASADGLILLCDADDEVHPGWLEAMTEAYRDGCWLAGTLDYAGLNSPTTREVWGAPDRSAIPTDADPYVDRTYGCNCAFAKEMWATIGRFDESISGTGGDETEMFMRAWAAGYRVRWVENAVVAYRLRPGVRLMARQRYRQAKNQVIMRRLSGGQHLPPLPTTARTITRLLHLAVVAPIYLMAKSRRYHWVSGTASALGRVVAQTQRTRRDATP